MTIYLDIPVSDTAEAALDVTLIVSIRATHAGSGRLPVVTVTCSDGTTRIFRFGAVAARDRFLLRLVDACDECHAAKAA